MKITFFASGEGYGHVGRCLAVAEELASRGNEVQLCTYGTAAKKASQEGWRVTPVPEEVKYVEEGGKLYFFRSALASWDTPINLLKSSLSAAAQAKGSDVLVVDNYMGGIYAGSANKLPTFSHFNCAHPASGFVDTSGARSLFGMARRAQVTLYDKFTRTLVVDYAPPDTVTKYNVEGYLSDPLYTGPLVRRKPSSLPSAAKLRKELELGKFILVARGGYAAMSDINPALDRIAGELGVEMVVLDPAKEKYDNLKLMGFEPELYFKLLKSCEMVLTHGGHTTLMECCAYGKPTALLISDDHGERLRNGRGMEELRIGKILPFSSANPESISLLISDVMKMKPNAKRMAGLAKKRWGAKIESDFIEAVGK